MCEHPFGGGFVGHERLHAGRPQRAERDRPAAGTGGQAQRALAAGALADSESIITGFPHCEDTDNFLAALRSLGVEISEDREAGSVSIRGTAGRWPVEKAGLSLGANGTALRFLTALCALREGTYELTGSERLMERHLEPIDP